MSFDEVCYIVRQLG